MLVEVFDYAFAAHQARHAVAGGAPRQHNATQRGYYSEATRRNSCAAKTINNDLSAVSSPRNRGKIYRARASSDKKCSLSFIWLINQPLSTLILKVGF